MGSTHRVRGLSVGPLPADTHLERTSHVSARHRRQRRLRPLPSSTTCSLRVCPPHRSWQVLAHRRDRRPRRSRGGRPECGLRRRSVDRHRARRRRPGAARVGHRVRPTCRAAHRRGARRLGRRRAAARVHSAPHADATPLGIAEEHAATEAAIAELDVAHTFLRNGWYFENYTTQIPTMWSSAPCTAAPATDASAAPPAPSWWRSLRARVLTSDGHEGTHLRARRRPALHDDAARRAAGGGGERPADHLPGPPRRAVRGDPHGRRECPGGRAALAQADDAIAQGALEIHTGDLSRLLGRPDHDDRDAGAQRTGGDRLSPASLLPTLPPFCPAG